MPKKHPFGPTQKSTDHGVMPPRKRPAEQPKPEPATDSEPKKPTSKTSK